jgi:hypothetical protein
LEDFTAALLLDLLVVVVVVVVVRVCFSTFSLELSLLLGLVEPKEKKIIQT